MHRLGFVKDVIYPWRRIDPISHILQKEQPFSWVEKYSYVYSGPYNKNAIALTFDDGPDQVYTPKVLDILKKYRVKATFFLVGNNVEKYPQVVKRIAQEGHQIGNHSYDHANLKKLPDKAYHEQIEKTGRLIRNLVGYTPKAFRPPYGSLSEKQVKWASDKKYLVTQWNVDTLDWKGLSKEEVLSRALDSTTPGAIILQHSMYPMKLQGSVEALDQMIPILKSNGTRLVTISQMFHIPQGI
ncbi:peptidoglycan/xylan/chitin deacetylase (PgdA/CDA1 family) [Croceifilum oryzae]|uniref:Peptidoglycan/xylan/chitin deacetylase (PgdA/CDA1 family) n=1 Tax=Croceifilum oryzae TaxID=1553429 RepID=A0AAJ1TPB3_9BACL|nr:polysaccharide deacetylase family protein [Croceifilum oryzae]MDQ0418111.1 peptidoglycan/xylan/chitin deacetylase (PgdA/CDA1 family) [Croceifilum oryzae]